MAGPEEGNFVQNDGNQENARNHPSNEDQNPREPLRGAQQKNGDRNPHHGEKPRRNNHQPRHSVPKTRNPQDDIDERDEVIGTMGAEIVKLRRALKEKEVDRASVSRGRTNDHGSKSRRSLTPVHSGRTKRHRSLNTIERVIKEFIPARSVGDSSYPLASFKLALPLGNRLRDSLTKRAATSVKELMDRVEKHARIEEDNNRTDVDMVESSPKDNGQKEFKKVRNGGAKYGGGASQNQRERSNPREAINTLFKEPIYKILPKIRDEPYFAWPPKMPGDPTKRNSKWRCSYHKDYGHMTANCRALKQHLEELVIAGHLRDFIDEGVPATATQPEQRRRETNTQNAPRGVIDMIHGIVDPSFENELRGQLQKARHMQKVLRVEPHSRRLRCQENLGGPGKLLRSNVL
ncbi:hypothetical protein Vadar_017266 [Vaccinium darrowii]|uniref:Uncharacterized protein n=1 Tax=Vaccinium darrowii TaxID=229202 RepID=A0ACB7XIG8_9ERIC|nr:hypothetical protein Vadar_017266 [Vaccinium darrowii]